MSLQMVVASVGTALLQFLWQAALVAALLALLRPAAARWRYGWSCLALFSLPVVFALSLGLALMGGGATGLGFLNPAPSLLPWLALGWIVGVAGMATYTVGGWWMLRRLRQRASRDIPLEWQRIASDLARKIGVGAAELRLSAAVAGPCVIGWARPLILLPFAALGMPIGQVEAILAHELAHIRRGDYLVNWLQRAVEVAFFFHPAVWWISARVTEEREHCCDDIAVELCGDRTRYARALVELAAASATPHLACAAGGSSVPARVRRIMGVSGSRPSAWGLPLLAGVALLCGAVLTLGGAVVTPGGTAMTPSGNRRIAASAAAPVARMPRAMAQPVALRRTLPPALRPQVAAPRPTAVRLRAAPRTVGAAAAQRRAAPAPAAAVTVALELTEVQTCAPRWELVRASDAFDGGSVWIVVPVQHCEAVLIS